MSAGCLGNDGDDTQESDESDDPGFDDYDPSDAVSVEDAGAVDDDYEFDRPNDEAELSEDISESRTLSPDAVHVVTNTIEITSTLTIEPGTIVEFREGTYFQVRDGGELVADGTEAEPILLTGVRLGYELDAP